MYRTIMSGAIAALCLAGCASPGIPTMGTPATVTVTAHAPADTCADAASAWREFSQALLHSYQASNDAFQAAIAGDYQAATTDEASARDQLTAAGPIQQKALTLDVGCKEPTS